MKTILIPTDFMESSAHAIRYAAALAGYIKAQKLVLYHTYSAPLTTSDMSFSFVETTGLKKLSEDELTKSREAAIKLVPADIAVETRSDYGFVEQQINEVIHEVHADLIVMGIENMGAFEEALTGSSAIHVMHRTQTPVLMVPPDAEWQPILNIAWACDYKDLNKRTPVWNVKPLLQATGARLHVVHNDPEHKKTDETLTTGQQQIKEWFAGTEITFALLDNKDLKEAMNQYVTANKIDLLIAIPKKHGWLEGLFSSSHSKQLAFHAHVPVVCVQAVG